LFFCTYASQFSSKAYAGFRRRRSYIFNGTKLDGSAMSRTHKLATVLSATVALFPAMAGFGAAAEPATAINPGISAAQDRATDLMILQNRLQRQQFQQQQQQFRQQDRQQVVPLQVQRPEVPALGLNCRVEVFGNTYVKNCR
jgi:hypothetical protein